MLTKKINDTSDQMASYGEIDQVVKSKPRLRTYQLAYLRIQAI